MTAHSCRHITHMLDRRYDGSALSASEEAAVQSHLAACDSCRAQHQAMQAILDQASHLSQLTYPRPIALRPLTVGGGRRQMPWAAALAGVCIVAAVAFFGGYLLRVRVNDADRGHPVHTAAPNTALTASVHNTAVKPPASTNKSTPATVRIVVPAKQARTVEVAGDFSGWDTKIPLKKVSGDLWAQELQLPPGRYNYIIIVDGARIMPDPAAGQVVDDGFGGKNSVIEVGLEPL